MTLQDLKATIAGKRFLAGNRTVRELVERLEECGVTVVLNGNAIDRHAAQAGHE
jgi:hypothetical protein